MTEFQHRGTQNYGGEGMEEFGAQGQYLNKRMNSRSRAQKEVRGDDYCVGDSELAIAPIDADFLADFIANSAFYVEQLEELVGEEMIDFWQCREHAYRIITQLLLRKVKLAKPESSDGGSRTYRVHGNGTYQPS